MKKSGRSSKSRKGKRSFIFICVLCLTFMISTASSYYLLKDRFALDANIEEGKEDNVSDLRLQKEEDIERLYKAKEDDRPLRSGTVYRKDTILVVAEDFIRQQMSPYGVRLLDLYLDKNGVVYMDFGNEIKKNFKGDVYEEMNLIGGLYSGLKQSIPGLKAIKILIEGKEAESLGGHIDISRPIGGEIARNIR